jgi:hypothetical protein
MQAALAATAMSDLGLTSFAREYPAWRGDGRPGYLDFLGIDRHNRLHVVETKVGTADVKGVLQSIDYVVWVTAHSSAIRAELGWQEPPPNGERVMIDFVLAPKGAGPAIGPYFAGQVEAIGGHLPWRVHVVADATADVPSVTSYLPRFAPASSSVRSSRWATAVGSVLGTTP